jgi:membrane protein DedA with SNARE-associated domain
MFFFRRESVEPPAEGLVLRIAAGYILDRSQVTSRMFEALDAYAHQIVEFVRVHQAWAAPIVFVLAFGESLAFISLLLPAWAALVLIGGLIGPGGLNFWHIFIAGSIGAALGDWLSYWIGLKLGPPVAHIWPLSRHPDLMPKGERFVKDWGVLAIFIGRFFGPLRASVPLVAGIFVMPFWRFQVANFASAFLWAGVLIAFGGSVTKLIEWIWR